MGKAVNTDANVLIPTCDRSEVPLQYRFQFTLDKVKEDQTIRDP